MRSWTFNRAYLAWWLSALALACCTGCPAGGGRPAPGRIEVLREPEWGRGYRLYVPSGYTEDRRWPLVVTCHGTRPFDCASLQIDEWKGVAEQRGFLVAAPELTAASALSSSQIQQQIERQFDDEKTILSMLSAIRSSRRIDDTRVFLTGWSAGNYVVLFTGLRHPEIFRALSLRQGNFRPELVESVTPFLDPHQPIQVTYADLDLLKDDAINCIDWLRKHGMNPAPLESYTGHQRNPDPVFSFFAGVVRNQPWVRLNAKEDPSDPLRVTLSARTSFVPTKYVWDFGDGLGGPEPAPSHRYAQPGTYTVRVALSGGGRQRVVRRMQLQVPRVRLGAPVPTTAPQP